MFIEKDSHNKSQGWIEVICGSMFSGKTEELIRRLKRAKIAKLKVEIFKPGVDTRYSEEDVVSHNATALHSIPVESAMPPTWTLSVSTKHNSLMMSCLTCANNWPTKACASSLQAWTWTSWANPSAPCLR